MGPQDQCVGRPAAVGRALAVHAGAAGAVGGSPHGPDGAAVVAEMWSRAPSEVCLIFDAGARWLSELVGALPANGHVVMATRTEPPLPLARLTAQSAVLRLGESDLRFSDDEVTEVAARRGVDPGRFREARVGPLWSS